MPRLRSQFGWPKPTRSLLSQLVIGAAFAVIALLASRWFASDSQPFWTGDPAPPADLQAAVSRIFNGRPCVTAAEAEGVIASSLVDLGHTAWNIERGPGVESGECVSSVLDAVERRVILQMALSPEVKAALADVADQLLERCLNREDAADLLTLALTRLGETAWTLRTDGPIGGPIDRLAEIERHVEAGCFIYSGTGWTAEGRRLFFIGGR